MLSMYYRIGSPSLLEEAAMKINKPDVLSCTVSAYRGGFRVDLTYLAEKRAPQKEIGELAGGFAEYIMFAGAPDSVLPEGQHDW